MPIIADRFPALIDAIRLTADEERMRAETSVGATIMATTMKLYLERNAPFKTDETHVTSGHPDNPIAESFNVLGPDPFGDGASASVVSDAPHIEWQRTGTKGGLIPASTEAGLWFWIGPPLRWPMQRVKTPGMYRMFYVDHPGFGPWGDRDFVEVAAEESEARMDVAFSYVGERVAFNPLREAMRG